MISPPTSSPSGGLLLPRVDHQPSGIAYSYGAAACQLSQRAGWYLDEWQTAELELVLSVHEDGLWACRDYNLTVARQQGKTSRIAAPRVLAGLLLLGEEEIFWSAHEVKTVLDSHRAMTFAFRRLGEVLNPNLVLLDGGEFGDIFVKIINNNGFEGFELTRPNLPWGAPFPPVQRLRFIARSAGSGRGMGGDCNVNDEAYAITDAHTDALAPTQLARPNPQDLYFSSPPLNGKTGAVLYDLLKRALAGDPRLGFRDYGLGITLDELEKMRPEERKAFLDDRRNWYAALPAVAAGRVPERSIEALRRKLKDRGFAREILGCWPVQVSDGGAWAVISELAWGARGGLTERPSEDGVVVAADVAWPDGQSASVALAGRVGDDETSVQVTDHRPGTSWVVPRLLELQKRWEPAAIVIDRKGPAAVLVTAVEEAGLDVTWMSTDDVVQAHSEFVAGVKGDEPTVRHYDQQELADALEVADRRPLGEAFAWGRRASETDISPLVAATNAVWGFARYGASDLINNVW